MNHPPPPPTAEGVGLVLRIPSDGVIEGFFFFGGGGVEISIPGLFWDGKFGKYFFL